MQEKNISIWFFIGSLVLLYGVLIFGYGIYRLFYPPAVLPVLAELHADIWWGALLVAIGLIYCIKFSPNRKTEN